MFTKIIILLKLFLRALKDIIIFFFNIIIFFFNIIIFFFNIIIFVYNFLIFTFKFVIQKFLEVRVVITCSNNDKSLPNNEKKNNYFHEILIKLHSYYLKTYFNVDKLPVYKIKTIYDFSNLTIFLDSLKTTLFYFLYVIGFFALLTCLIAAILWILLDKIIDSTDWIKRDYGYLKKDVIWALVCLIIILLTWFFNGK